MADQFNDNIPTLAGQLTTEYPDIEENFGWIQRLLKMLIGYKTSDITTVSPPGRQRSKFTWNAGDKTIIKIGPGVYFHDGTTRQTVFWDAEISFDCGGATGDNSDSTNLGASETHYLYIDDSAVVTQANAELDADCFLNSTTAPTWSDSKHGYYNGSDLCIFPFKTDGGSVTVEWYHDGGEEVHFADQISENIGGLGTGQQDVDTTWLDVPLTIPGFCTRAKCTIQSISVGATVFDVFWRTNGQTGTTGHVINDTGLFATANSVNTFDVFTDASQTVEIKHSVSTVATSALYTNAWFFPIGM